MKNSTPVMHVVTAMVTVAAVLIPLRPVAAQTKPDRVVVTTAAGERITVSDITLVSWADAQAKLNQFAAQFDPAKFPLGLDSFYHPASEPWQRGSDKDWTGFYELCLRGAVEKYVGGLVYDKFIAAYPDVDDQVLDKAGLELNIALNAATYQRLRETKLAVLQQPATPNDVLAALIKAFPNADFTGAFWRHAFDDMRLREPYERITISCFPELSGGRIAPWVEWDGHCSVLQNLIPVEINRHRHQYIDGLEHLWGDRMFIEIDNALPVDCVRLTKLIAEVAREDGSVDQAAIDALNHGYRDGGSPVRIFPCPGSFFILQQAHNVSDAELKLNMFIRGSPIVGGRASYYYSAQVKCKPQFKEYPSTPGNPLYDYGNKKILDPIIEDVLRGLVFEKGMEPKSGDSVRYSIGRSVLRTGSWLGITLPEVLKK
jgi:hypothetical protein